MNVVTESLRNQGALAAAQVGRTMLEHAPAIAHQGWSRALAVAPA